MINLYLKYLDYGRMLINCVCNYNIELESNVEQEYLYKTVYKFYTIYSKSISKVLRIYKGYVNYQLNLHFTNT